MTSHQTFAVVHDVQASGKFSATGDDWDEHLALPARYAVAGRTERLGSGVPEGWKAPHGDHESDVLHRGPWTLRDHDVLHIDTPTWRRGSRTMRGVDLYWSTLWHEEEEWLYDRLEAHAPAHLYRKAQRAAHTALMAQLPGALVKHIKHVGAAEGTAGLDFNMNLLLPRNVAKLEHHGLHVVAPSRPTHGLSVLDGLLSTMDGHAQRGARSKVYDHRLVTAQLRRRHAGR